MEAREGFRYSSEVPSPRRPVSQPFDTGTIIIRAACGALGISGPGLLCAGRFPGHLEREPADSGVRLPASSPGSATYWAILGEFLHLYASCCLICKMRIGIAATYRALILC